MNKSFQLSIVLLLFLSFSVLALNEDGHVLGYNEFAALENPTVTDFSSMSWEDQSSYLENNYQQEYALQFFATPQNAELYPDLAEKFFSGGEPPSADLSRNNFQQRPEAAGKFFSKKYGGEGESRKIFTFENLAGDFEFNKLEGYLKNNGLKLSLEEFKANEDVTGVRVVQNRFVFIPKDVPEGTELAVSGEAGLDLSLEFDTERKILRAGDVEIDFAFAQQGEAEATEVTLHADRFEVTGAASGRWKNIQWTNREGKLVLYENGDINARNAEVFASDIYVNGYVEKRGNKIKAWAYGDSSVNDGQTIVIDRRSGYGVKVPQARSVIPPEVATIEIQELGPPKPLSSDEISEPDVNLLRALARSLLGGTESNPTNKDLHVLISHNNDDGRTKITAIGTGEIGFYGDGEHAKFHRPYFIGKNGASLLSLETNGETTIATGGQVSYSDAKIAVDTEQENAYLRLKRNKGDTSDFIQVQCMGCDESNAFDEGSAFLIHKAVPLGEPFSSGEDDEETGLFRNFDTSILSIEVNVKDGKAVFDADRSIFGAFAEQQERHAVLLDTTIFEIPGEEGKQQLRLGQEKGIAAMVVETLDAEGNRLKSPQRIDFSSRIMMGEPIIVTTETNLRTIEQLLSVQGEERIDVLANSEFDEDPALRKRLLRDLEIDIDLRKNPEYVQELRTSLQEQRFADEQIRELEQKYGIVLKDGVCRGEDCNKITRSEVKGENLFLLYSAIQINQRQAANTRLGALLLSGENKENEENDKTDKKFIQEIIAENSQEIARLVTRRNNVNEIAEGRIETARKAEDRLHLPEGYADDALEAENLGAIRGELAQMRSETKADLDAALVTFYENGGEYELLQLSNQEIDERVRKIFMSGGAAYGSPKLDLLSKAKEIKKLQSAVQSFDVEIRDRDERGKELSMQHFLDRPELATELALKNKNPELVRTIADDPTLSANDADILRIKAHSLEGNVIEISKKRQFLENAPLAERLTESQLAEVQQIELSAFLAAAEEHSRAVEEFTERKATELFEQAEEQNLFWDALDLLDYSAHQNVQYATAAFDESISVDDGNLQEILLDADLESYNALQEKKMESGIVLAFMKKAATEGKSVEWAWKQLEENSEYNHLLTRPWVQSLRMQSMGIEPDRELQARVAWDAVEQEKVFNNGDEFFVIDQRRSLAEKFAGTPVGRDAQNIVANYEKTEIAGIYTRDRTIADIRHALQTETAAEIAGATLGDATNLIGGFGASAVKGTAAVLSGGTRIATTAIRSTQTAGRIGAVAARIGTDAAEIARYTADTRLLQHTGRIARNFGIVGSRVVDAIREGVAPSVAFAQKVGEKAGEFTGEKIKTLQEYLGVETPSSKSLADVAEEASFEARKEIPLLEDELIRAQAEAPDVTNLKKDLIDAQTANDAGKVAELSERITQAENAARKVTEVSAKITQLEKKAETAQEALKAAQTAGSGGLERFFAQRAVRKSFREANKELAQASKELENLLGKPEIVQAINRGEIPTEVSELAVRVNTLSEKAESSTIVAGINKFFDAKVSTLQRAGQQTARVTEAAREFNRELERFEAAGGIVNKEGDEIIFSHQVASSEAVDAKKRMQEILAEEEVSSDEILEAAGLQEVEVGAEIISPSLRPASAGCAFANTFTGRAAACDFSVYADESARARLAQGEAVITECVLQRGGETRGFLPRIVPEDPQVKIELEDILAEAEGISPIDRSNLPVISGETELLYEPSPDFSHILPRFSPETVTLIDELGLERRVGRGGKSKTFSGFKNLPESHPLRELGLEQATVFETSQGRVVIKPAMDDALEQKLGVLGRSYMIDTARRDIAVKSLLSEVGNHVAKTEIVTLEDGTKVFVSEFIPGLKSLGKRDYYNNLKKEVDALPLSPLEKEQVSAQLFSELHRYVVTNLGLNNADAELAIGKLADGKYHVVGFDFELAFQGLKNNYVVPWETNIFIDANANKKDIAGRISSISGNDYVAGPKRSDLVSEGSTISNDVLVGVYQQDITLVQNVLRDREKVESALRAAGYTPEDAAEIAGKLENVDLNNRLVKSMENDGKLFVSTFKQGELFTQKEALAQGEDIARMTGVVKARAEVLAGEVKPLDQKGASVLERGRERIAEARAKEAAAEAPTPKVVEEVEVRDIERPAQNWQEKKEIVGDLANDPEVVGPLAELQGEIRCVLPSAAATGSVGAAAAGLCRNMEASVTTVAGLHDAFKVNDAAGEKVFEVVVEGDLAKQIPAEYLDDGEAGLRRFLAETEPERLRDLDITSEEFAEAVSVTGIDIKDTNLEETFLVLRDLERPLSTKEGLATVYHVTRIENIKPIVTNGKIQVGRAGNPSDTIIDELVDAQPERLRSLGVQRQNAIYAHPSSLDTGIAGRGKLDSYEKSGAVKLKIEVDPNKVIVVDSEIVSEALHKIGRLSDRPDFEGARNYAGLYWKDSVSLQEFRDFYVLKSPGRRKGVMADVFDEPLYVLDEDKVKAAGYPHKLPKSITAPEVLIPHDVPIEQVQVVEYNAKMREVFKEAAGLNVGVKKVGEEKKIGIIPDVVPSVGCALSGFGCVKVVDETPSEIERVARVPEITEVGKEVKVISEIAEETVEKPSTFAKLWPFKLNKHRNVEVPGVKFSTVDITIPGIPNRYVTITEGDVSIKLYKKNVWRPSNFDDQLEFGDEFLQLHVDVTPSKIGSISAGKDAIKAFDKLKKLDLGIPIVGDTTNPALLKQAEKMGGKRVKAPNRFRLLIEENSGPLKEGDKIVERVIILPEKVGVGKAEAKAAEDVVGVGKERVVVQEIEEISEVNQKDEIMGLLKDFPLYQRNPQEL